LSGAGDAVRALILAAGQGKRMRSRLPKVLHPLAGRPMIRYVLDAVAELGMGRAVVVIPAEDRAVRRALGETVDWAVQEAPRGTADAVAAAARFLPGGGHALVLCGDTPLVTAAQLTPLLAAHLAGPAAATLLTARPADPTGYGRVVRDAAGQVARIVEESDATPAEAAIGEVNTGIYCFRTQPLLRALGRVRPDNAQGEYYLTDCVAAMVAAGETVAAVASPDAPALEGVNDRRQLARAEAALRGRILERLQGAGVRVEEPGAVVLDWEAAAGADTRLGLGVTLAGRTRLGRDCRVGAGTFLRGVTAGDRVRLGPHTVLDSGRGKGTWT
jgi:bifunctional UDP-N-acetylglucosamine pyrophosphorylase/glucosamine-1-phosphate N-acetyltransferase